MVAIANAERMDAVEIASALLLCAANYYMYVKTYHEKVTIRKWRKRRWWMVSTNRNRTRQTMEKQLSELVAEPSGEFEKFTRMSLGDFEYLLHKVGPIISKQDTQLRDSVPPKIRLAVTLRFLASGDSFESLHFLFKISSCLISRIIPEVCAALNKVLKDKIKLPSNPESWLEVENGFKDNFPRCVGAIDGKHIVMQSPIFSGSEYHNYKKSFSIVLLALVDHDYKFLFADIGSQGRISDGGVFRNSLLWHKICSDDLNLPPSTPLPGSTKPIPYVFLGDGAFALSTHVMKPYPGEHNAGTPKRIFNKKLSSSRVFVENTFGILASKFRIFRRPILLDPEKTSDLTMTCILLHNFLRKSKTSRNIYTPPGTIDVYDENGERIHSGTWRTEIEEFQETCAITPLRNVARRPPLDAKQIREEFTSYFFTNSY